MERRQFQQRQYNLDSNLSLLLAPLHKRKVGQSEYGIQHGPPKLSAHVLNNVELDIDYMITNLDLNPN
jgi:hypothetical protein